MKEWIALLRGINVGGRNKLPMNELKNELAKLGLAGVETYIQSGNVVFNASGTNAVDLAEKIGLAIQTSHGFKPHVVVLRRDRLRKAVDDNPFSEGVDGGNKVHFFFMSEVPRHPDVEKLAAVKAPTEEWKLSGDVFYLHAPDGLGRSKLASAAERLLGVSATARNSRSVARIMDLAERPE